MIHMYAQIVTYVIYYQNDSKLLSIYSFPPRVCLVFDNGQFPHIFTSVYLGLSFAQLLLSFSLWHGAVSRGMEIHIYNNAANNDTNIAALTAPTMPETMTVGARHIC